MRNASGLNDLVPERIANQFGHRMEIEFKHHISAMRFCGLHADVEASEFQPDVTALAIGMPLLNGVEATPQIRKAFPAYRVRGSQFASNISLSKLISCTMAPLSQLGTRCRYNVPYGSSCSKSVENWARILLVHLVLDESRLPGCRGG